VRTRRLKRPSSSYIRLEGTKVSVEVEPLKEKVEVPGKQKNGAIYFEIQKKPSLANP